MISGNPVVTSVNEVYNIATNTWETKAPLPDSDMNLQATVINGEILVKGVAYLGEGSSYIYNPATDNWSTSIATPFSSWYQTEGAQNYLQINVNNKTMITGVQDGAATETSGINGPVSVYVIGSRVNEVYSPSNDSWTKGAVMPTLRSDFGLAVSNDLLYAIGGFSQTNSNGNVAPSAVNEQYTPFGYSTQAPTASPTKTPTPTTTQLPSPNPTVPEFQVLTIPILFAMMFIAGLLVYFKKHNK